METSHVPQHLKEKIDRQIAEEVAQGWLRPTATSAHRAAAILAKEESTKIRRLHDYSLKDENGKKCGATATVKHC